MTTLQRCLTLLLAIAAGSAVSEPPTITRFAGNGEAVWNGLGESATTTALVSPNGLALDAEGRVLIAEGESNQIFRIGPAGEIEVVAGCGFSGFAGDGGPAVEAFLAKPYSVIEGASGEILIADQWNHRIREVGPDGSIRTVVGSGEGFFGLGAHSGDGGPALKAGLNFPSEMAFGEDGSLFIADQMNARVRRVTPDGVMTTYAGVDGTLTIPLKRPIDLLRTPKGTLLIVDAGANQIYSASPTGEVEILIGAPISETMTPKHPGIYLDFPVSVEVGVDGALIWAESKNNRICRLAPGAKAPRILMEGRKPTGLRGAALPPESEQPALGRPTDLLSMPDGSLLAADPENHCVWRIVLSPDEEDPS